MAFIPSVWWLLISALLFASALSNIVHSNSNITVIGLQGTNPCTLLFLDRTFRCSLGKNGVTSNKIEGDGCTPIGSFHLRRAFYRADRILPPPSTALQLNITQPNDGWCDDSSSPEYNQFVTLPFLPSHENLWREDTLYDYFAVIGWNDDPVVKDKGSAIFFHVTESYGGTSGCVALNIADLIWVLARINADTFMNILLEDPPEHH